MDIIYGKEETKFKLNIVPTSDNSIIDNTIDWYISDLNLDGSDNSSILNDTSILTEPTKVYESSGLKEIRTNTDFDDGWGNIYTHQTILNIEVKAYSEPVLNFSWNPIEPTILDTVTFTQNHNNTRDSTSGEHYGRIDKVRIDFYNNSNFDIDYILKNEVFQKQFNSKQDNIPIKLEAYYWDGFEYKNNSIIKTISMSNIPPVSDWIREDKGVCVPAFEWTASSSDLDDDIDDLLYSWKLYQEIGTAFNLIDTSSDKFYKYPFQYEGKYRIDLETIDSEGSNHIKSEIFDISFGVCGSGSTGYSGKVILQPNRWQIVAIPTKNKKISDVVDIIKTKTNKSINEVIEVINAYPSNNISDNEFLSFVPGFTNINSKNNFNLIESDSDSNEITAFWIKTLNFENNIVIEYTDEKIT